MSKPEILVVGSYAAGLTIKTSRFPSPGETVIGKDYKCLHGGKGSNQAVACARQGASVNFIACIGEDPYGQKALDLYRQEGINTAGINVLPEIPTGVGFIIVNDEGENEIVIDFGANERLSPKHIKDNYELFERAKVVLMQMEIPIEAIKTAVDISNKAGIVSILNPAPYHPLSDDYLRSISLLTPNETEAKLMLNLEPKDNTTPEVLAVALQKKGVKASIITLGKQGMLVTQNGFSEHLEAFYVDTVDTTGAGDAFTAALGVAIAEGASLKEAASFAAAAAALTTLNYGVIEALPSRAETAALLHSHN